MDEHVVAAVIGLNKAEALCRVEPLDCSGCHLTSPRCARCALCPHDLRASLIRFQRCLGEGGRFGRIKKENGFFEWEPFTPLAVKKQATRNPRDQRPIGACPNSPASVPVSAPTILTI